MATSGGIGGGLAGDRGSENFQPIWSGQGQGQPDQPHGAQQPTRVGKQPRMNLTKEEMQALQDCSRESFYYRCIPLGLLFMGTTQILVNKQILRGHPRLGAIPKNMFAGLVAYIMGKVSYQGECRRKIMALPNSPLGEAMRQGKKGKDLMQEMSFGSSNQDNQSTNATFEDPVAPKLKESYLDGGSEVGLDDNKRPNIDNMTDPVRQEQTQAYVTYDELRKKNRAEHDQRSSPSNPAPLYDKPAKSQYSSSAPSPRVKTNQYGDVVEE